MGRMGHASKEGLKKGPGVRGHVKKVKKRELGEKLTQLKEGRRRKKCFLFWLKLTAILR